MAPALVLSLVLAACAGVRPAVAPAANASPPSEASAPERPWTIPADAYPSQMLFRMEAETSDGEASVRVVLRLQEPDRYRLTLSDRLGRTLYTVDVGLGGGWLADHRSRQACPIPASGGALVLRGAPLEGLAIAALPAVLLGRVPAEPASPILEDGDGAEDELSFRDPRGRRWTVRREGTEVVGWTLWQGGEPVLWWRRDGERALLSDRLRGAQLRWQTVAREGLPDDLAEPAAPAGFEVTECRAEESEPFDSPQADL